MTPFKKTNPSPSNDGDLFLLEVLVDKVSFVKSPCFSEKDFRTCVTIAASGVQPLELYDDDPGSVVAKSGGPFVKTFGSGKSCLFTLPEAEISKAMSTFPITVTVHKSLPCGCLPTKIIMGITTIDMTKEFVESRNKYMSDPGGVNCQALKDLFQINGPQGERVGDIAMFLRISCFGKLIVTKFQGPGPTSKLGATRDPSAVDQSCNAHRDFHTSKDPCVCSAAKVAGVGKGKHDTGPPCQLEGAQDPFNFSPCLDPDDICYCSGPRPPRKEPMVCRNMEQYCLHVPKGPTKAFEEIGSNLGGNELKIKIPANLSIIKKISQTHCAMQSPYTKKTTDGICIPPCGKNRISLAYPGEDTCCGGLRPQGTQFTCTTEGCVQAQKHGQQSLLARGDTKNEIPNNEVFVLKVAKTAIEGDRKCKLELELVTPKGPDKKQPVRKVNARCATDPDCTCCGGGLRLPKGKRKR
ncbi:hypothetical protein PYW07_012453 [Mythimna separata]|uniref:Uncharacterized protein n=1 Tax=Mythimna separata TaxID=271217 RepID=A0AAD7YM93_MYTSE|nr:hypothetical protein PYW07_012453 [Mythimna separata]